MKGKTDVMMILREYLKELEKRQAESPFAGFYGIQYVMPHLEPYRPTKESIIKAFKKWKASLKKNIRDRIGFDLFDMHGRKRNRAPFFLIVDDIDDQPQTLTFAEIERRNKILRDTIKPDTWTKGAFFDWGLSTDSVIAKINELGLKHFQDEYQAKPEMYEETYHGARLRQEMMQKRLWYSPYRFLHRYDQPDPNCPRCGGLGQYLGKDNNIYPCSDCRDY